MSAALNRLGTVGNQRGRGDAVIHPGMTTDQAARERMRMIDKARAKPSITDVPDGAKVELVADPRTGVVYTLYRGRVVML